MRRAHGSRTRQVRYEQQHASTERWKERDPEGYRASRTRAKRIERLRFPEAEKAHRAVAYAISMGRLQRPSSCQACNTFAFTHAHHHLGYDQPLEVQWLCQPCHTKAHLKEPEPFEHSQADYLQAWSTLRSSLP